jgi:hypothetical protein
MRSQLRPCARRAKINAVAWRMPPYSCALRCRVSKPNCRTSSVRLAGAPRLLGFQGILGALGDGLALVLGDDGKQAHG